MKIFVVSALFWLGVVAESTYDRKITSHLNPGCGSCNDENVTMMYIQAQGEHDILHSIWDFSKGKPTVLLAMTGLNVFLTTQWGENSTLKSFIFSETPKYGFGLVIDKIWEFNDSSNTGIFDKNNTQCRSFDTSDLVWSRKMTVQEEGQVGIEVVSHSFGIEKRKGDITLKMDFFPYTSYSFDLPHLTHTANSTIFDIVLENMTTSADYSNSRFALDFTVISTERSNETMQITTRKGLDDEHTPGVFEIVELITPDTVKNGNGSFLQYRPISYIHPVRDVASSTKVETSPLSISNLIDNTTASIYFEVFKNVTVLCESFTVSFGAKDDGFYKKSNYTIWSFSAGYGRPPSEGFSLLVILILSIGLGVPLLLLVLGGVFVCVRKYRRNDHDVLEEE